LPRPSVESFPDADALVIHFLNLSAAVSAPVMATLPLEITSTVVRVTRIGGANRDIRVDRPLVDVDVFSPTREQAMDVARACQNELLFTLRGTTTPDGTVQHVTTTIGPHWLPDINPNLVRVSATYELHVHA